MKAFLLCALLALFALHVQAQFIGAQCTPYDARTRTSTCTKSGLDPKVYAPSVSDTKYISACHITNMPTTLLPAVRTLFPEGGHPDPIMIRPDVFAYITLDNTNISFTYVSTGAGNTNRLGFAVYDPVLHNASDLHYVWPTINNNNNGGTGCLSAGDTYKFGPFNAGTMLIFFLDSNSQLSKRYWSYFDPPFGNPDVTTCPPNGCIHGSWAYLTDTGITVFGFEDLSLGDADYNDVMFFLSFEGGMKYNEVPTYTDSVIYTCNLATSVLPKSLSTVGCVQWGLLESTVATSSCLAFLSIPDGWTWANYDDPDALGVISKLANKWSYTNANCFLLRINDTAGQGFRADGSPCLPDEYKILTMINGTSKCLHAACTSRFVLRGASLGSSCTSQLLCDPTVKGSLVSTVPLLPLASTLFPISANAFLRKGDGSVSVSTTVQLGSRPLIDIMVLADFSTIGLTTLVDGLLSSWTGFPSQLLSAGLNASLGLAYYNPSSTLPLGYSISSSLSLTITPPAINKNILTTGLLCPASGQRKVLKAAIDLMGNNAIAWRNSAFKVLVILSTCPFDAPDSSLRAAAIASGVVPIAVYAGLGDIPTSWPSLLADVPLSRNFKAATVSVAWSTTFSSPTLLSNLKDIVRQVQGVVMPTSTLGDQFLALPSTPALVSATTGIGVYNYTLNWPTSLLVAPLDASIQATVRIMGRDTTLWNILFNHAPIMNDVAYSFVANANLTISFTPSDSDNNQIFLIATRLPTKGKLYWDRYDPILKVKVAVEVQLLDRIDAGIYIFTFVPFPRVSGGDWATFNATDGCELNPGNVSVVITFSNSPPVAEDFTISIAEDSLPTGNNGIIDFSSHISDPDITAGISQTLTVQLLSLPSPSSNGALTSGQSPYGAVSIGSIQGTVLRYNLTQPLSGRGNVTFSYQVSDGTDQGNAISNRGTVTIVITPVAHAPILAISPTSFTVNAGSSAVSLSGSITDYDGQTVNLYAVATNITMYAVSADDTLNAATASNLPFAFYSANQSVNSNSVYNLADLAWSGTTGLGTEYIDFQAQDSAGSKSNIVRVYLSTIPTKPPRWTLRPINDSYAGPLTMTQGDTLAGLQFAATDDDGTEWQSLRFQLATAPTHGVLNIKSLSGAADLTADSSSVYQHSTNGDYVGLGTSTSYFSLDYVPNADFYGTETFTFTVRDPEGHYASESATVTITVNRKNTAPSTASADLRTSEFTLGSVQIPAISTNVAPASSNIVLTLLSVQFSGNLFLDAGQTVWAVGQNTSVINGASDNGVVRIYALGNFGIFSSLSSGGVLLPIGTFTYQAYEPSTGLVSIVCTGNIFITHVNHAPTSQIISTTTKKGDLLAVTISAMDPDADDTPPTNIQAKFQSISSSSKGKFFFDQAMTRPLTSDSFDTFLDAGRTFYYLSEYDFSTPQTSPLATFTFVVVDSHGLASQSYDGSIIVTYALTPPVFGGSLSVTTYQETPVPIALAAGATTESGAAPIVTVLNIPDQRGTFAVCADDGTCAQVSTAPQVVTSSTGRVIFVPQDYDWDNNFAQFNFSLTDPLSGAVGVFTMNINVLHVNKKPVLTATNFFTTSQSSQGIIVNESTWRSFDWKVTDVDSLPSTLTTSLRVSFYTSQGFQLYSCQYQAGDWNTPECEFDAATPFADRADFAKNAKKSIAAFETNTTACPDFATLKEARGVHNPECEAHFKVVFVPTPEASYTPYISITFTAVDDAGAESTSVTALIFVKAVNAAPTIWAPAVVLGGQGVKNPFIRDTASDSPTFNQGVSVADSDSNGNIELLTIRVVQPYSGTLLWPDNAPCQEIDSSTWQCLDRIDSFNQWLSELRFEVSSGNRAELEFFMNDLGWSSDYKPSANLTSAIASTSVRLTDAIAAPSGNNSTLAISVGVAAGVGLLLLGALGFFLKRSVTPPTDDYFSSATTPITAAPTSPLYEAQHQAFNSPLYKGY